MGSTQFTRLSTRPDAEVLVPAYGGHDVAEAVRSAGARPVPADIDPRSLCIAPNAVLDVLTPRTVAIAALHLFGHPPDLLGLRQVTQRHALEIVECGVTREGPVSLDDRRRRQHAAYLNSRLTGVEVPAARREEHNYDTYVVRVPGNGRPDRDAFKQALRTRGIRCWVPVRNPLHWTPGYRSLSRLPHAERAADECLALPVDGTMTRRDLQRMASACNALGGLLLEPAC
ncbi:hypothetical protein AN216_07310 [Streptomyces oceani]|uniref:DegT/DnrJ/EryC1/StrS aminotransferase n=2 Tax=Streptomyces oceani TaxID=1075402 RepID=A0A1E7KLB5_9ACTN|nr:hypothetical protein AN216_07310 [Streptomyces oceani]